MSKDFSYDLLSLFNSTRIDDFLKLTYEARRDRRYDMIETIIIYCTENVETLCK